MLTIDRDVELWGARIRPYFEPHLRDTAERIAVFLASAVGIRIKQLRPETPIADVLTWFKDSRKDSLDWVEMVMALEEELLVEISDEFAETFEEHTFRELVEHIYTNRRGV